MLAVKIVTGGLVPIIIFSNRLPMRVKSSASVDANLIALKVVLVYAVVGGLWIALSDNLLGFLIRDPDLLVKVSVFKGGAYVLVTALLLYALIRRYVAAIRRHEQAAREEADRYRLLAENVSDVIWTLDLATRQFTYVSPSIFKLRGYTPEEVLSQSLEEALTPESFALVTRLMAEKMPEFLAGGSSAKEGAIEVEQPCKDGSTVWAEVKTTFIVDENNRITHLLGVSRDITARKLAEESLRASDRRFKELLENVHMVAVLLDQKGNISFCNDFLLELRGWSYAEVQGRNWFDVFIPLDIQDSTKALFFNGIANGEMPNHYENEIHTRQGARRTIVWDNTLLRDAGGAIVGTASLGIDVTEHRSLEAQLRQSQKMEAIGQLAGGVAHDFNNILTGIMGFAALAKTKITEVPTVQTYLDKITILSEKAANLTRNLLAFSRRQVMEFAPVNVNAVVTDIHDLLADVIGKNIGFLLDLTDDSVIVTADPHQLEQVLMNLVSNARDAMPDGGVITIRTGRQLMDAQFVETNGFGKVGSYVFITVADTGMGIEKETLEHIFEPFFTTKAVGKGTGLGLAMIYGIVKQHNGYVRVESKPSVGTSMHIYLPLAAMQDTKDAVAADAVRQPPTVNETILLAEDDDAVRQITRLTLEESGYKVIEAQNGEDAVGKFIENMAVIDMLLFDVVMPKLSGKEAFDRIKVMRPDMRILFVSGYSDLYLNDREETDALVSYIQKPINPDQLLEMVRDVLRVQIKEG